MPAEMQPPDDEPARSMSRGGPSVSGFRRRTSLLAVAAIVLITIIGVVIVAVFRPGPVGIVHFSCRGDTGAARAYAYAVSSGSPSSGPAATAPIDVTGQTTLELPPGTYELVGVPAGYTPQPSATSGCRQRVTVAAGDDRHIDGGEYFPQIGI